MAEQEMRAGSGAAQEESGVPQAGRAPGDVPDAPAGGRAGPDAAAPPDARVAPGDNAGVPPGTGLEAPAPLGTSEDQAPVQGIHTPEVGPGGADIDTAEPTVPGRPRSARGPG